MILDLMALWLIANAVFLTPVIAWNAIEIRRYRRKIEQLEPHIIRLEVLMSRMKDMLESCST